LGDHPAEAADLGNDHEGSTRHVYQEDKLMSVYIGLAVQRLKEGVEKRPMKVSGPHENGAFTKKQVEKRD
jgi:hypothetical protein